MKKLWGIVTISLTLAGCVAQGPEPAPTTTPTETVTYGLPSTCEVEGLLELAAGWEAFDQTEDGVTSQLDCAVGTPNSDVGVWFGFKDSKQSDWDDQIAKLTTDGYLSFDAGYEGAEVWRKEDESIETGPACLLAGRIGEVSFSAMEPWVECEDSWNAELATLLLDHAKE